MLINKGALHDKTIKDFFSNLLSIDFLEDLNVFDNYDSFSLSIKIGNHSLDLER